MKVRKVPFYFKVLCTTHCVKVIIYITSFTSTKIYTHQTLVNLLHVSARHKCHHQGVLLVAKKAPSKWSFAKQADKIIVTYLHTI